MLTALTGGTPLWLCFAPIVFLLAGVLSVFVWISHGGGSMSLRGFVTLLTLLIFVVYAVIVVAGLWLMVCLGAL